MVCRQSPININDNNKLAIDLKHDSFINFGLFNKEIISIPEIINNNILHSGCLCIEPNNENDIQKIINCIVDNKDFIKQNSSKRSGGWISLSSRTLYDVVL